jgi:hypothetical protein
VSQDVAGCGRRRREAGMWRSVECGGGLGLGVACAGDRGRDGAGTVGVASGASGGAGAGMRRFGRAPVISGAGAARGAVSVEGSPGVAGVGGWCGAAVLPADLAGAA